MISWFNHIERTTHAEDVYKDELSRVVSDSKY